MGGVAHQPDSPRHPAAQGSSIVKRGDERVVHRSEYVWEALDVLGVDRIDHGNRALEDEALVARLRGDQVPLTVCPLSNLKLAVVGDLSIHPLKRMLDLGLLVTVNSDDPAYFGGYINENYVRVAQALRLDEAELEALADNSFAAAFGLPSG